MIGSILGGAFRLLRQHPLSVLVWSILYLVGIFAIGMLRILALPVEPQDPVTFLVAGLVSQGLTLALIAVLITAATRATLHPYKRGACYLRLGASEGRVFVLLALLAIASAVAMFLMVLANGFVLSLFAWLVSGTVAVWIGVALLLAEVAGLVFVQVRLSIALPLTYLYEAITVDEAWAQSRGHFWAIFGAFFTIGLLLLVGWGLLISAFFAPILADLSRTGLHGEALAQTLVMITIAGRSLPAIAQLALITGSVILAALGFVLTTATLASAARELLGLKEGQIEDLRRRR
ncbi:hypothetical protein [Sphingomonas azotifigens]|uniref:hypothetical protein n=1 Tax=Sphingomonas azotifigens TaxID=330920 RepID=UPI000A0469A8|nr:hypothetical protein [Sphingomonas azotifigens]